MLNDCATSESLLKRETPGKSSGNVSADVGQSASLDLPFVYVCLAGLSTGIVYKFREGSLKILSIRICRSVPPYCQCRIFQD